MKEYMPASLLEVHNLGFTFPSESEIFSSLSFSLSKEKVGLIGDNGCGKTTLLRLLSGQLKPSSGSILINGTVYFLKQSYHLEQDMTIGDYLQVTPYLEALKRVEQGLGKESDFVFMDGYWDIQEQLEILLETYNLHHLSFERKISEISGGEATLLSLAAAKLMRAEILLLDEPSNNLDAKGRAILYETIDKHNGVTVVATHDRSLLERMDKIIELKDGCGLVIEGRYETYLEHIRILEESAERDLREAQKELNKIKKQYQIMEQRQAKQRKVGKKAQENKRGSKKSMNALKRKAQVSAGKERGKFEDRCQQLQNEKKMVQSSVRKNVHIRVSDLNVGATHRVQILTLQDYHNHEIIIGGGERVALLGENGIGKSRLIESIFDLSIRSKLQAWGIAHTSHIGLIRQNVLDLNEEHTLIEELSKDGMICHEEARAQLARMLFRRDAVYRKINELSGGQRFHIALAKLLVHKPAYEMIILDEPTNNLDLSSLKQVVSLLKDYKGALLVVSHDADFLEDLNIQRYLHLSKNQIAEQT